MVERILRDHDKEAETMTKGYQMSELRDHSLLCDHGEYVSHPVIGEHGDQIGNIVCLGGRVPTLDRIYLNDADGLPVWRQVIVDG